MYHTNWNYAKVVKFAEATTVTDQEVMVILSPATIDYSQFRTDGFDVRFYTLGGSIGLDYFRECWNPSGETYLWVKVHTIGTLSIQMEWGYTAAADGSLSWLGYFAELASSGSTGWTQDTSYNGYFPRGAASPGGTGGSDTHTHPAGSLALTPLNNTLQSAPSPSYPYYEFMSTTTHTHTITGDFVSGDTKPKYSQFGLWRYNTHDIPLNLLLYGYAFFNGTPPAGWSDLGHDGYYFRIGSYGFSSGAHAHTHAYTSAANPDLETYGNNPATLGVADHDHAVYTNMVYTTPPYVDLIVRQPAPSGNTRFDKTLPVVALFLTALPPLGWGRFTALDGKFPRANSTAGGTGGNDTHTHTVTVSSNPEITEHIGIGAVYRMSGAAHTVTGTMGTGSSIPAYKDMLFAQRKTSIGISSFDDVTPSPIADFVGTPRAGNGPTLEVTFTNQSTGIDAYTTFDWDWGDGTTHGTTQDDIHDYSSSVPTAYTVIMRLTNSYGTSVITKVNYISLVHNPPVIHIAVTPETGVYPLTVYGSVTDFSYGPILSYDWDWGDNSTHGSGATPSHQYTTAGVYLVTCVATNAFGTGQTTEIVNIIIGGPGRTIILINNDDVSNAMTKADITHAFGTVISTGTLKANKRKLDALTTIHEGDVVAVYKYYPSTDAPALDTLLLGITALGGYTDVSPQAYITQRQFLGSIKAIETTKGWYIIEVEDPLILLTKFDVNKVYGSAAYPANIEDILYDLIQTQAGLDVSIDNTQAALTGFKCNNRQAYEACQALCNALDWQMYYDPRDRTVHVGSRVSLVTTIDFDTDINVAKTPKWTKDLSTLFNNVVVTGKLVTSIATEQFTLGATGKTSLQLAHQVSKWRWAKYLKAGTFVTLTQGTDPPTEDNDYYLATKTNQETQETVGVFYIYHRDGTSPPQAGDVYQVQYEFLETKSALASDAASIETYGNRALPISRPDLTDVVDLQNAADAYIMSHKLPIDQVEMEVSKAFDSIFWIGDLCDVVDRVRPLTMTDMIITRWTISYPCPLDSVQLIQKLGVIQPFTADYLKALEARLRQLEQG